MYRFHTGSRQTNQTLCIAFNAFSYQFAIVKQGSLFEIMISFAA